MSSQTLDRTRRRKAFLAWGALAGAGALITAAAFTDQAFLNIGSNGIGGSDSTYNLQVGATDEAGDFIPGQWQEAGDPAGVPINLPGADALFPGSDAVSVAIPVRNDSARFGSTLAVSLEQLAGRTSDADYLASLRFSVTQPATSLSATPVRESDLTFAEVQAVELNRLAADETSEVTLAVRLAPRSETGAEVDDNDLAGKGAYVQAVLDGSSV